MRATTLKASPADVGGLLANYAGLADNQVRRDRLGRGPIDDYLGPAELPGRWWGHGCAALGLGAEVRGRAAGWGTPGRRPAANPSPLL
jgi:hypothetical protein